MAICSCGRQTVSNHNCRLNFEYLNNKNVLNLTLYFPICEPPKLQIADNAISNFQYFKISNENVYLALLLFLVFTFTFILYRPSIIYSQLDQAL